MTSPLKAIEQPAASAQALLAEWIAELARSDRAAATRRRYEQACSGFLTWAAHSGGETIAPADLTPIALAGYRSHLQSQREPATVNTALAALRAWSKWLAARGYLDADPAARLKLVRRQAPAAPRSLSPAQANALLREAERNGRYPLRDKALVMLLLQTGIRIGEAAALNFSDIEFGERAGKVTIRAGKGNKSRSVPLNASARQALAEYAAPRLNIAGAENSAGLMRIVGARWPKSGDAPLWQSERGGQGDRSTVSALERVVSRLVAACAGRDKKFPAEATAHWLRHTFAMRYLASNPADLAGLSRLMGHDSLDTTRIYLRPTQEQVAASLERLDLNAYG